MRLWKRPENLSIEAQRQNRCEVRLDKNSALHLVCKGRCYSSRASALMKVSTQIESREQKKTVETIQEENFGVSLIDSKCTPDDICKYGCRVFGQFHRRLVWDWKDCLRWSCLVLWLMCWNLLSDESGVISNPKPWKMDSDPVTALHQTWNLHHISELLFFSHFRSIKLQWQSRSHNSSTRGLKIRNSVKSWPSRAKLQGSTKTQWLNFSRPSGGSGSKISNTSKKYIGICSVGSRNCLAHNFEPNTDCGSVNYQTQHRVNLMHQPGNMSQVITIIIEHGWISMTSCPKQIHQTRRSRGLKCLINHDNSWREASQNSWDHTDYHDSWWQGSWVWSPQPPFCCRNFCTSCPSDGDKKPSVCWRRLEVHRRVVKVKACRQKSSRADCSSTW